MSYQVKYSARRQSIGLSIKQAQVTLHLPIGVSEAQGHAFFERKKHWVEKHLAHQQQRLAQVPQRLYGEAEALPFLGETLRLEHRACAGKSWVEREGTALVLHCNPRQRLLKPLIERWYQQQAQAFFKRAASDYAARLNLEFSGLQIKATRSRWGACSSRGVLQFHPLLLLAPRAVAEYVAVHEVCHLKHMNHAPAFWALVAQLCPDFQKHRQWLKAYGHCLVL